MTEMMTEGKQVEQERRGLNGKVEVPGIEWKSKGVE